jgi:hypothetical protein
MIESSEFESKFTQLDSKLKTIRESLPLEIDSLSSRIEKAFQIDHQIGIINSKRDQLLENCNSSLQLHLLNKSQFDSFLYYGHKNGNHSKIDLDFFKKELLLKTDFSSIGGRLNVKNELSLYKKLLYLNVYNESISEKRIQGQNAYKKSTMNCLPLTPNKYLLLDLVDRRLTLLNHKFQTLKSYKINQNFYMNSFDLIDQSPPNKRLVFLFNDLDYNKCFIIMLDFKFRLIHIKQVKNVFNMELNPNPPHGFFYKDKKSKKLHILDHELNIVQKIDTRGVKFFEYCSFLLDKNRFLIDYSDFTTNLFNIVVKNHGQHENDMDHDPYSIIKTLTFKDFINVVKIDQEKRLYFIRTWAKATHDPNSNLFCFDSFGRFLFKRYVSEFNESNAIYFDSEKFTVL